MNRTSPNDVVIRNRRDMLKAAGAPKADLGEIGTTGLRQYGGFVLEEWMRQLQGRRLAWTYREMGDNDPVIGAILFAIEMLSRGVDWHVQEGDSSEAAEFIEQCMNDMAHTWLDFIGEALSCVQYGWSFHELVYKRRQGPQKEPVGDDTVVTGGRFGATAERTLHPASSKFTDGRIGWRKLPVRAQETLLRWHFDESSNVQALEQIDWQGNHNTIPIEKALLFRTKVARGNPEGQSILRRAYIPWARKKNVEEIEAIGIERDLAGIPVATPPEGVDLNAEGNANLYEAVRQLVTSIRRDEYEGVVLPQAGWKLELLTTGGGRQIDTSEVVRRYDQRIATSMLADFILIGQDAVGSYAMVDVKADLFGIALDAILDLLCEVMNRYAIPRLLELNGMGSEEPPEIHHGSAGRISLEKVGAFFNQMALAGAPIPWSQELIEQLFAEAGLPVNFDDPPPQQPQPEGAPSPMPEPAARTPAPARGVPQEAENEPEAQPVEKASIPSRSLADGRTVIPLAPVFHQRARLLQNQLRGSVQHELRTLGGLAERAYLQTARKADSSAGDETLVSRIIAALNLPAWFQQRLQPLLRGHAGQVLQDTVRTVEQHLGLAVNIPDPVAQTVLAAGGTNLGLSDIEPQIRAAILKAVQAGRAAGLGPGQIARTIREQVPAGPFVHAGPAYRSQLISRSETMNAQRASTIAAYRAAPNVQAVEISDGLLPDSDATCIARDGSIVSFDTAASLMQDAHPLCTMSFSPVVVAPADVLADA